MKSNLNKKIVLVSEFSTSKIIPNLDGSAAVCNGHFNVMHPGHHRFLHFVKDHADNLIVIVVGDHLLAKDKGRHFFPEQDRANTVAALEIVDRVILIDHGTLEDAISYCQPSVYSFGREFEVDRRFEITHLLKKLEELKSTVVFGSGDISYVKSNLFGTTSVGRVSDETLSKFVTTCKRNHVSLADLKSKLDKFRGSRVLVIGDSIVDHFVACDAIGMSAEAPVLAVKEIEKKSFIGGAAIVAAHVSAMGAQCTYLSVVGNDEPASFLEEGLAENSVQTILYKDNERPTTFKIRYMVENQKLLRVSRLQENHIPTSIEEEIIASLPSLIKDIDAVIISDFVYGVITPSIVKAVTKLAKENKKMLFGDVQCSSQVGDVSKFKYFDLITPTEREARIALSDRDSGIESLANNLQSEVKCRNLMITVGANGVVAYQGNEQNDITASGHFPALIENAVDAAGAGDAMLSASSLALLSGCNLMEATVFGSIASAVAVTRIGNLPVKYEELNELIEEMIIQQSTNLGSNEL